MFSHLEKAAILRMSNRLLQMTVIGCRNLKSSSNKVFGKISGMPGVPEAEGLSSNTTQDG